jgi:hypothetical protein
MKFSTIFTALASLIALTSADEDIDDGFNTTCPEKYIYAGYNDWMFGSLLDTYHASFGGGGGSLDGSFGRSGGSGISYQGVCCNKWCLYVEKGPHWAVGKNKGQLRYQSHWNDEEFNAAVDRIRPASKGTAGGCNTVLNRDQQLKLYLVPYNYRTSFQQDGGYPKSLEVWQEFGDTCAGDQPYRGPGRGLRCKFFPVQ